VLVLNKIIDMENKMKTTIKTENNAILYRGSFKKKITLFNKIKVYGTEYYVVETEHNFFEKYQIITVATR